MRLTALLGTLVLAGCGSTNPGGPPECTGEGCTCVETSCQCPGSDPCTSTCGDDCRTDCGGSGGCVAACGDRCVASCGSSTECVFDVGSDSTLTCSGSAGCDATCYDGCTVSCTGSGGCTVRCEGGSCDITCTVGEVDDCGDGVQVCARPCPSG